MTFVPWRDRKELAKDLKAMYTADSEKTAKEALTAFEDNYQKNYPTVAQIWRRNWLNIIPIFDYPADIRKAIYTTIVIESLIYSLKEPLKTRGAFPTEDSLMKVLYLAINNALTKRAMPIHIWMQVLNWFAQLFDDSLLDGLDTRN